VKVGEICEREPPPWRFTSETHAIRCHIPLDERHPSLLDGPVDRRQPRAS
jgi:hypothetical protein